MARDYVDSDGLNHADVQALRNAKRPADTPFELGKLSHVVLKVSDMERSVKFYTEVMGMRVSDVYPESMMPGRMVFLRCNNDHHGVALVGGLDRAADNSELHHFAFEVATLDELFRARAHLQKHGVPIAFEGRRRAGAQIALEFADPDNHQLEICWAMDQVTPDGPARPPEEWRPTASLEEAVANAPPGQDTTLADPTLLNKK